MEIIRRFHLLNALVVSAALFVLACSGGSGGGNQGPPQGPIQETPLTPEEQAERDLEIYLKEQYAGGVLSSEAYGVKTDVVLLATSVRDAATPVPVSDESAEVVSSDAPSGEYSETNIQEAGVDEADRVKTDGTYMYVAGSQEVSIVKAVPADAMSVISAVEVDGRVGEIYLYDGILVVLFSPDDSAGGSATPEPIGMIEIGMPYWLPVNAQVGVMLVDVSDGSAPNSIRTVITDGTLVSSRLTGGKLHIVQQYLPDLPALQLNHDGTEEDRDDVIDANLERLEDYTLDELIPSYEIADGAGGPPESGRLVAAEDFYQPEDPQGGSIVTLTTFDMNAPDQDPQSVGIIADAHFIYASTQSLYLGATIWNSGDLLDEWDDHRLRTVIHKFDLAGDEVRHLGSGDVPGEVLNQFSLGEYDGVLRIATTTGQGWWGGSTLSSNVYCLRATGDRLETIGEIEGLAPGESLYSARFIGTRGFLVTFVKVDPLFTLDLSDPTDPEVVGELKVPGYSDYIHLFGEDHLLTIGKDTKLRNGIAWYQGVQLSIFDISDFANPALLHKELVGDRGTHSEALYSHKAFTFWPANDLLAIPVDLYEHQGEPDYPSNYGSYVFSGLYVFRATVEGGLQFLGRIDTSQSILSYPDWTRGIFIDDSVYAVKSGAVYAADVADIDNSVNTLSLVD